MDFFEMIGNIATTGGGIYRDVKTAEATAEAQAAQAAKETAQTQAKYAAQVSADVSKTKYLLYGSIALLGFALVLKAANIKF